MEIVALDRDGVEAALADLAQLLLDAHDAGMALGLAAPLTPERARSAWLELAGRLEPERRELLVARDGGRVVGSVHLARAAAENGTHRAEIQRLAVRADRRGGGIGRALLAAAVARARELGLRLLWLTTHEGTGADRFYVRTGWTRLGVMPGYARLPDGSLAGNAFFYLEL